MRPMTTRCAISGALALLLAACTGGTDPGAVGQSPTPRVVELSMEDMRFVPERVEVRLHETVRFLVRNPDDIPHEVFLGTDAEQLEHRAAHASAPPGSQADVPHFGYGAYVHARGTEQFMYRFDQPGPVTIGCHLPGHWEGGMRAEITVAAS